MVRTLVLMVPLLVSAPVWAAGETVALHKTPSCMCCEAYANYLRHHGFEVTVTATRDLSALKEQHGVPEKLAGCHTAFIGPYVFEGHIPVDSVRRVLDEQPAISGTSVPGMPAGSPGMPGELREPIRVWTFADGADSGLFTTYQERPE